MLRKIKCNRLFREDWKCRWRLTGCQYKSAPEYRHSNHSMQSATKLLYVFLLILLSLSGAEWTVTPNTDCSPGQGGEAIGQDSDTTSISLSKCLTACEEDDTCVAVVRQANDEAGFCQMRFSKATASSIFQLLPKCQVQDQLSSMCSRQGFGRAHAEQRSRWKAIINHYHRFRLC